MTGTFPQLVTGETAQWYADFIETLPLGVYRTTLEGKLVFCNSAFAQLFGFDSADKLIDYPVIKLYRKKKDRGNLIQTIIEKGRVVEQGDHESLLAKGGVYHRLYQSQFRNQSQEAF